jgi:hypothetical protein
VRGVPRHEDVDDALEDGRLGEEAANVIEAGDALEGVVWQVLGDFTRLLAILLVDCFVFTNISSARHAETLSSQKIDEADDVGKNDEDDDDNDNG